MKQAFLQLLVGIAVSVLLPFILNIAFKEEGKPNTVKQSVTMTLVACFIILIMGSLIVFSLKVADGLDELGVWPILIFFLLMTYGGVHLLLRGIIWRITYDDEKFVYRSMLGKVSVVSYSSITNIVSDGDQWKRQYKIFADGEKYVIGGENTGSVGFLMVLHRNTPNAEKAAISHYGKVRLHNFNLIASIFFLLTLLCWLVSLYLSEITNKVEGYILLSIFIIATTILFLHSFFWRLDYNESQIFYRSSFGRTHVIDFKAITRVKLAKKYFLFYVGRKRYFVDANCIGYSDFWKKLNQKAKNAYIPWK